jgi:tRNA pseudouridine55 synthase
MWLVLVNPERPEGFFALFKVPGVSSAHALSAAKGILQADKVGFLGTLDVPAMGVLPIAVGSATRLISFLPSTDKEYVGELVLGVSTVTDDMEGEPTGRPGARGFSDDTVRRAIEVVAARTEQVPPHVSAKRRDGVRGYDAVRGEGHFIDFSPVPVSVRRLALLRDVEDADLRRVTFRMTVTPGFYVRGFCRDVGFVLGCGACMGRLLRTSAHGFGIGDTLSLVTLRRRVQARDFTFLVPGDTSPALLGALPRISLDDMQWADFCHGLVVDSAMGSATTVLVTRPDGRLGGVAGVREGRAWPLKVFAA